MMKIAHISSFATGGAGIAAFRVHKSFLNKSGISSVFIQRRNPSSEMQKMNIIQCEPNYSTLYRIKKRFGITNDDFFTKQIKQVPENYETVSLPVSPFRLEDHPMVKEADIINLHWVADFINYPLFFKNIKQPIVWTLHDMNPFQGIFHYREDVDNNRSTLGDLELKALKIKESSIHSKDNITIVTPSLWLKNLSQVSRILSPYKHFLIPYGLDFSLYPHIDRHLAKKEIRVDNGNKTILFVAHSTDIVRKGFKLLQKALSKIDVKFNLISIGDGKIDEFENLSHIHFNHINDIELLNAIYSAADITVIPSREDNLPNVMLESFANGTPVISFSNGGMAEHIITGKNGILIENEISSEALRKNIVDFLDNKYNFEPDYIKEYAENHFSEQRQLDAYIRLYNKILCR